MRRWSLLVKAAHYNWHFCICIFVFVYLVCKVLHLIKISQHYGCKDVANDPQRKLQVEVDKFSLCGRLQENN